MPFAEPTLPYDHGVLEPHISTETMQFHFGKHNMAYYNKLTALAKGTEWDSKPLEEIIKKTKDMGVFNQAAQLWNHSLYWNCMRGNPDSKENVPTGLIATLINEVWSDFESFKKEFSDIAVGHFGSGWAWLVLDGKKLKILSTHDADCPLRDNRGIPIINCDLWEHAYYLDYRNARPEYIKAWWYIVNWDFANANLQPHFSS